VVSPPSEEISTMTIFGSEYAEADLEALGHDNDLIHIMCCKNRDVALCGDDITGSPVLEDGEYDDDCVVCDYLGNLKKKEKCKVCPVTRGDVSGK
jgi:hypothetical protein